MTFLVVLQHCAKHNVKTANQISIKFCVDIICQFQTCQTFQSYSPKGYDSDGCYVDGSVRVGNRHGKVGFLGCRFLGVLK